MATGDKFSLGRLDGKVALITGASSGIGAGAAKMFSQLGAQLAITGRNEENLQKTVDECEKLGNVKPFCIQGDLAKEEDTVRVVEETVKHYGRLDILVNSAGIVETGSIETTSLEQYDHVMNINTRSMYHITMLAVPHLVKTKGNIVNVSSVNGMRSVHVSYNNVSSPSPSQNEGKYSECLQCDWGEICKSMYHITMLAVPHLVKTKGNIVNVSSVTGVRSFPNVLAYCMSKSAVDQLTRCCALELAPKQVRVNSINPGVIKTEIHKRGGMDEEAYQKFLERTKFTHALGRPGEVEEAASMIAFLASDNASFITGAQIPIDGGRHAMCPR